MLVSERCSLDRFKMYKFGMKFELSNEKYNGGKKKWKVWSMENIKYNHRRSPNTVVIIFYLKGSNLLIKMHKFCRKKEYKKLKGINGKTHARNT